MVEVLLKRIGRGEIESLGNGDSLRVAIYLTGVGETSRSHDSIDRKGTGDPCRGQMPALMNNSNPFNLIGSPYT